MKNIETAALVYKQLTDGKKPEDFSHEALIIKHMLTVGPITPMDAIKKFDCTRLSARIYDLENSHHITVAREKVTKGKKTYMRYWLEEDDNA
mgnify:CR=1 FL=1